ncbi:hypothetical protein CMO94_03635 [Candidatus Woesearchaeota archaeon]|mgnify:CR=1 FL=1|jgi:hypothetical protein|nr:hypothetical protein [Candidatus Woesearchaeota archaeon]|tara:strand:- start:1242 stop:1529 length:288 start_codon:yes stop_codon:yes gene_type:complete
MVYQEPGTGTGVLDAHPQEDTYDIIQTQVTSGLESDEKRQSALVVVANLHKGSHLEILMASTCQEEGLTKFFGKFYLIEALFSEDDRKYNFVSVR